MMQYMVVPLDLFRFGDQVLGRQGTSRWSCVKAVHGGTFGNLRRRGHTYSHTLPTMDNHTHVYTDTHTDYTPSSFN
jgi:hypothetical protein